MHDDNDQPGTTPKRIQRRRVKGWRSPPNTVYVGRGSPWGNPYRVGTCLIPDAQAAVDAFQGNLPIHLACAELRGKNLSCWCPLVDKEGNPVPCHADVLLEIANQRSVRVQKLPNETTHGSPELDEDARKLEALGGVPGPTFADLETTEQLTRDFIRERWFGEIQTFLEQMIDAAPDETCRVFGRDLWQQTAEFTDGA